VTAPSHNSPAIRGFGWDVPTAVNPGEADFDRHLEDALEQADARVNRLHANWSGAAAAAHRAAHDEWKHGAEEMRAALAVMRRIAKTTHANYTGAASANSSMWGHAR
jgi:WXG100 family type VII secretion target